MSNLVFQNDGTATDPNTGLMWMVPLVGQGWDGSSSVGSNAAYTWHEATERYGRGRLIKLPGAQRPFWEVNSIDRPFLASESYKEYQFGTKKYEFAGFNDWRMPLVEEVFTLMETGTYNDLIIFNSMCTANPSTVSLYEKYEKKSGKSAVRRWLGNPYPPFDILVWEARVHESTIFGDHPDGDNYWVRLVRAGYLFQAIS